MSYQIHSMNWHEVHTRKPSPLHYLTLWPLTFPYGVGVIFRTWLYNFVKKREAPGKVISIGNLTVGGTGKSPAVCMLARWMKDNGYRVSVISRGYKGTTKNKVLHVSDGKSIFSYPRECGDEPYMMAEKLRDIPVLVSRNRYLACMEAHNRYGSNIFILDDGFQHLVLKRDLDIVLIDCDLPFGNGHLLPLGPLREPVSALTRADMFFLTRCSNDRKKYSLTTFLNKRFPKRPVFYCSHIPEEVIFPDKGQKIKINELKGISVGGFAGIARPDYFKKILIDVGAELVFFKVFDDHYNYKVRDIEELKKEKEKLGAEILITTQKDWVKINNLNIKGSDIGFLTVKFKILAKQDEFFDILSSRIGTS